MSSPPPPNRSRTAIVTGASSGLGVAMAEALGTEPVLAVARVVTPADLPVRVVEIYENYEFPTEVLVASVRGPFHVVEAARMGADICTCPPKVIEMLFDHPLTDIGLAKFLADWEKAQAVRA